jgi:hypothetical protein
MNDDIGPTLEDELERLEAENQRLREEIQSRDEWHRAVMDEECPDDEKHCTCVPLLRDEIRQLRKAMLA